MVVIPYDADPIKRQRIEWGQNIQQALDCRMWTRKRLVKEIEDTYGLEVSLQAVGQWIKGDTAPNSIFQAAVSGVTEIPHHLLFPPIRLERRRQAA